MIIRILLILLCINFPGFLLYSLTIKKIEIKGNVNFIDIEDTQKLIITHDEGQYKCNDDTIKPKAVDFFYETLTDDKIGMVSMNQLGLVPDELNVKARRWFDRYSSKYYQYIKNQGVIWTREGRRLFLDALADYERVTEAVDDYYASRWPDDFPFIYVSVFMENGTLITINSQAQHLYMVPWEITHFDENGSRISQEITYNLKISEALLGLIPNTFPNYKRLSGIYDNQNLSDKIFISVFDAISRQLSYYSINKLFPKLLTRLRQQYLIHFYHLMTRRDTIDNIPKKFYIASFKLQDLKLPENFLIYYSFPVSNMTDTTKKLEPFLQSVGRYTKLIQSISWLQPYLLRPELQITLYMYDDLSLENRDFEKFSTDMKKSGKADVIKILEESRYDACKIFINEGPEKKSTWIVLPDQRMILWDYLGFIIMDKEIALYSDKKDNVLDRGYIVNNKGEVE